MARRISSLFSSRDGDVSRSFTSSQPSPLSVNPQSPSRGKLVKSTANSPAELSVNARLDDELDLPPVLADRAVSSRPSSRDEKPVLNTDIFGGGQNSLSRPQTPTLLGPPSAASPIREQSPNASRLRKRRSWIPGKSDRPTANGSAEPLPNTCPAWIAGLREQMPYDLKPLLNGEPVSDLWDEKGDVIVHLFPQSSRKGPSFRVNSQLFADSRVLSYLTQPHYTNSHQTPSISLEPSSPMAALSLQELEDQLLQQQPGNSPMTHYSRPMPLAIGQETKTVFLPLNLDGEYSQSDAMPTGDDMELIVLYRNFFAFLCGGALVATLRQNSLYAIFMSISTILGRLQYGNDKGSSWGAVPWASFSRYTDELRLADVRASREKNIEAIVLGIAMKSWPLYVEGFSHAVGRLDDIKAIASPKFDKIPPAIINKLERANYDLQNNRLLPLRVKLDNFYFPSMFSGVANSTTATEAKLVRFKAWKAHFMDFRSYTMTQYKKRYGNWPPKASSKKNNFEESGLNRLLIREMYQDFTDLYELLVDRTSLTPRTADSRLTIADDAESGTNETIQHALRSVEGEYDRSTPPVSPPIPFDVPLIPAFGRQMLAKDAQSAKRLKEIDLENLLLASCNKDGMKTTAWIQDFREYEYKLCHGKTIQDIVDVRCGQWLFMYAVLQALPMTVVDARDLHYTDGVEHFLCEAPRGGRPWVQDDVSTSRAWFNVASGGGLVSMPADTIDHSVEGIYRRSHCWTIATKWAEAIGPMSPVQTMSPTSTAFPAPQMAPSPYLAPKGGSAAPSPYGSPLLQPTAPPSLDEAPAELPRISSRSSMNIGLHEVAAPTKLNRPVSTYNPHITFDNILASQQISQKTGKKGKK